MASLCAGPDGSDLIVAVCRVATASRWLLVDRIHRQAVHGMGHVISMSDDRHRIP